MTDLFATFLTKVLKGSRESKLLEMSLHTLSSYGRLSVMSASEIRRITDFLVFEGYLRKNEFDALFITEKAVEVNRGNESVYMEMRKTAERGKKEKTKKSGANAEDSRLYELLRQKRLEIAKEENVPAYIIFSNATLSDMAKKAPETYEQFLTVTGVGQVKADLYADEFTKIIKKYASEN